MLVDLPIASFTRGRRWLLPAMAWICFAGARQAIASTDCPASAAERQAHATPVLTAGARPWAMRSLPPRPPAAPKSVLPPVQSESRRQLARRFTFVLSGLPPREDDVSAFLADPSPGALDKVLDRLLAAAAAPQRLAEVWLRATRYSDRQPGNASGAPPAGAEAWRYRDWAVDALRTTTDARRLARLTLAGDGAPGSPTGAASPSNLLATFWHLLDPPRSGSFEETVVEWTGRQAERTAQAFLALDLSCARCHDHPSVPLPTDDAAGIVAIFAHTQAFVPGPSGAADIHRHSMATPQLVARRARALQALEVEETALAERRRAIARIAAAEFLPQTAEYVRAAWKWHHQKAETLDDFAGARGLLAEPLGTWAAALGLTGDAPPSFVASPWWAEWAAASGSGSAVAVAAAARTIQEHHQIDDSSPFFSTSGTMDAFLTLDQQTQLSRLSEKVESARRAVPEVTTVPGLAEGAPASMPPPALTPSLPALLTSGTTPTTITPPAAGRRALATWLDGEGGTFFARLMAVRLAEGLGAPLMPPPTDVRLWSATPPAGAERVDAVAACLVAGGWPAAAKRILQYQAAESDRPPVMLGGSEWRDAVLWAAGTLDPRQGGPPDLAADSTRRSLYREWAPVPTTGDQDWLEAQSAALAALTRRRAGADPAVQITWLVHHLFQRPATPAERTLAQNSSVTLARLSDHFLRSPEFRTYP